MERKTPRGYKIPFKQNEVMIFFLIAQAITRSKAELVGRFEVLIAKTVKAKFFKYSKREGDKFSFHLPANGVKIELDAVEFKILKRLVEETVWTAGILEENKSGRTLDELVYEKLDSPEEVFDKEPK